MAVSLDLTDPQSRPIVSGAATKPALTGMTREKLGDALRGIGVADKQVRMRVQQLWHWLYIRGVDDFAAMTNVSKDLRAKLADAFTIEQPGIVEEQISADGTRKWLLRFPSRGAG
ncbi:MAG: 23S rRNA (adenine(2503)-C(2))-methyltransferase RlmN, partial [Pseudomonadota bacterium]